ncbi:MAG: peptidase prolyl oligopeptidase active site protein [Marmoricola sp.]|nr:peptidase prolyl oligopeptidase active site protein [Marmoricola sp.]
MKSRIAVLAGGFLVVLGVFGCLVLMPAVSASDPDTGPTSVLLGASNDTSTPFNLVDLPALARHDADGHDLELGMVLERGHDWTKRAISYRGDGLRITGTLTLQQAPKPAPVIVTMHGYLGPATYTRGAGLLREERRLADAGFVVLHPDYRNFAGSSRESGTPVAQPLGYPDDVINAILALRAAHLAGVDGSRVGLFGRSMGGGVALDVAVARPDLVAALLLYSPVSSSASNNYDRWVSGPLRTRVDDAFSTPARNPEFWADASAVNYLSRIDVPVEIHHGLADQVCPEVWSEETAAALRAAGKQVQLFTYAGEEHRFDRQWPLFMERALAYFKAQLDSTQGP